MNTKTEEVQELVVLTDKQIKALPTGVKDNVVFLTKEMGAKDLMVLNPMVTELIDIRVLGSKTNMIPADKEGKFNKANIQTYIDLKKKIRSFRAGVKTSAKILKAPYQRILKGIIAIEKTFIDEATSVFADAEKEFSDYDRAEELKAIARQEAKDKVLLDKIEEQKAIADEAQSKLDKSNLYNKIKYELINGLITDTTAGAVNDGSEKFVSDLKASLEAYTYELITTGVDDSILEEAVIGELKHYYINAKQKAIIMLSSRLEAFELTRKNAILEHQVQEEVVPPVPTGGTPAIIAQEELTDEQFGEYIQIEIKRLYVLSKNRINSNEYSTPRIHTIKDYLGNFLNFNI